MADLPLASIEAEVSVIGGVLTAPVAFSEVSAIVSASDFSTELHRRIFSTMTEMDSASLPIDVLTIAESMEAKGTLQDGDWAYIGVACRDTPSAANILYYARIVRDRARRRALVQMGSDLQRWAFREDSEKAINKLKTALDAMADGDGTESGLVPIKALLPSVVNEIDRRFEGIAPKGLPTGIVDLDTKTGGLKPGLLYLVAGRPAMGKSVLGLQIAARVVADGAKAAYFTAEMPNAEQVERLVANSGQIDLGNLQTGKLDDEQWTRLTSTVTKLSDAKLWFDETGSPMLSDLLAKARRLKRREGNLGLVVVDHAGLVESGGENRQNSQSTVARALKGLAKELSCPVVALVQLSRKLEERTDKRPLLSDLRDSGEWEQSADVVAALYRDEVYNPDGPDKGCAELLIRKHRGGVLGIIPLQFLGQFARFESMAGGLPSWNLPAPTHRNNRGIDF
ncbi:MAG: replicative DNA helicase [Gammaproteobacteria bacterium]|nr:replicative DNA helicase [Gammaproteobacteria bacterium]